MPKSCADLKQLAYRKSGIFSVMGNQRVEKVYCDFTKQTGETGFQKLIGIIDVKSMRVSFHAQRTTPSTFNTVDTTIPFEVVKLNEGNAMDSTTGIFTAPTPGTYFFAFTGLSSASKSARVEFQVKTATVDWSTIGRAYGAQSDAETFALDAIVQLSKGDQIRLFLKTGEIENFGEHNTNFVGLLLEEVLG
ncbi:hypothetical protein GHT06_015321 [Daphnia sinensis]|uniref:C1q domain-containing protein n=1 Tax=Daphnia sinensis TaxID=1820382 RepID=A0AAD5LA72_9CRUS|nr:hypothetical protein GHT06_015321 [Daphnia sinensis]